MASNPTSTGAAPEGPRQLAAVFEPYQLSLASRSVHADDYINSHRAVAPPMHLSTTFRYSDDPDALKHWDNTDVSDWSCFCFLTLSRTCSRSHSLTAQYAI